MLTCCAVRHRHRDFGFVEFHIDEPTGVLHALTGWAVERGEVLSGLAVNRPSLEDVYLSLTGEDAR